MDQKNTIVKCNRSPKCLFEHNGVCDNYVINICADGKCECYIETEILDTINELGMVYMATPEEIGTSIKKVSELIDIQRGQRAKCNFYEDACDDKETVIAVTQDELLRQQMCWYCDNGSNGSCKLTAKPALDRSGKCPRYTSTGGNR